jgi:hypothetical protein
VVGMSANLVKWILVILKDPGVCEVLQRVYYCDGVEGCIEGADFAWVLVIDTPVMSVGQGSFVLKRVCLVEGKGCALDLLLVYKLLLPFLIRVMNAMMVGTPGVADL